MVVVWHRCFASKHFDVTMFFFQWERRNKIQSIRLRFDFIKYVSDISDYYVLYTMYIYTTYST